MGVAGIRSVAQPTLAKVYEVSVVVKPVRYWGICRAFTETAACLVVAGG